MVVENGSKIVIRYIGLTEEVETRKGSFERVIRLLFLGLEIVPDVLTYERSCIEHTSQCREMKNWGTN